jgi:hypothetical protein
VSNATNTAAAANTTLDAIAELRKIARGSHGLRSITERGIALLYRGRYESSAAKVAELVAQAGGDVWSKRKVGKTVVSNYTATRTWRVEFTVGTAEDSYIASRIDKREMLAWLADQAALKA